MSEASKTDLTASGDGDWSYLRANLDSPRHLLAHRLGIGLMEWFARRWQHAEPRPAPLAVLARLPLGPRQAVSLVEADGVRLLVGTSADHSPSFLPLHPSLPSAGHPSPFEAVAGKWTSGSIDSRSGLRWLAQEPGCANRASRRPGVPGRVSW